MTQRGSARKPIPETNRRSSGLVISLLVLVFASLAAAKWHDRQIVDESTIIGATDLSKIAVTSILDSCLNEKHEELVLSNVRNKLEAIPFVLDANVHFSGVRGLTAVISERNPVAHIVRGNGSLRYVDASGTVLPDVVVRTAHCVPILRFTNGYTSQKLAAAAEMVTTARTSLDPCLFASISEFIIESDNDVRVLTDGLTWRLGNLESSNATDAYANMNVFWNRLASTTDLGDGLLIDLRWKKHVILRDTRGGRS